MSFYEKSIGIQQFLATCNLTIYGVNKRSKLPESVNGTYLQIIFVDMM
jgi:hypothetical protein